MYVTANYIIIHSDFLERTHLAIWDDGKYSVIQHWFFFSFVILHRHHVNIRPRHKTFSA